MLTVAMARPVGKTYSRTTQKVDSAAKAFDDAVLGVSGRPCSMKATSIIQKWGKASFTSTRGSLVTDPQKSRKRKIGDDEGSSLDDDPFSFDLEDVGPSKVKKGMGYKVPEKPKANVSPLGKRKNVEDGKKVLRASGKTVVDGSHTKIKTYGNSELENKAKRSPALDIHSPEKNYKTDDSIPLNKDRNFEKQKPSPKKQLLMDHFTNKPTRVPRAGLGSTKLNNSKPPTSDFSDDKTLRPNAAKKFFVSRDRKTDKAKDTTLDILAIAEFETGNLLQNTGEKNCNPCDEAWNDNGAGWDLEDSDPEITFNTSKRSSGDHDSITFNEDSFLDQGPPCLTEDISAGSKQSLDVAKKVDRRPLPKTLSNASSQSQASAMSCDMKPKSVDIPVVKRLLTNSKKVKLIFVCYVLPIFLLAYQLFHNTSYFKSKFAFYVFYYVFSCN